MSDIVPADEIEAIVGVKRHQWEHWARAVSAEQKVYILHSQGCLDDIGSPDPLIQRDLRDCPYSLALDRGIEVGDWIEDEPVLVTVGKDMHGWYLHPLVGEDNTMTATCATATCERLAQPDRTKCCITCLNSDGLTDIHLAWCRRRNGDPDPAHKTPTSTGDEVSS